MYVRVHVCKCVHMYVREYIHQCKHIDLSMGCLVHCVTLPMVPSSKLITHDEMINLVYVPLSVHCIHPSVQLSISPLHSEGFLLGAPSSLISLNAVLCYIHKHKGLVRDLVPLSCTSNRAVQHIITVSSVCVLTTGYLCPIRTEKLLCRLTPDWQLTF